MHNRASYLPKHSTRIVEMTRDKSGYGFTLSGQAPCFISWIVKLSPADRMGLSVGDYVISVNGADVSTSTHEAVVKLIGVSYGALLLGVAKSLDGIDRDASYEMLRSSNADNTGKILPLHELKSHNASFSRAEKVLKDLHSGAIFKSMPSSALREKKDVASEEKKANSMNYLVLKKSIVAYLGTIDMGVIEPVHQLEQTSLETVRRCVQQLMVEQHIHQRLLMKVTQSGVKLHNADDDVIGVYKSNSLRLTGLYNDDERFFYVVTIHEKDRCDPGPTYSCHIFMVDPHISPHAAHADKAKRFGVNCSTDENGDCVEFPKTPRNLLSVMRLLYMQLTESSTRSKHVPLDPPVTPQVHVVDRAQLTRGESSLPSFAAIKWNESEQKSKVAGSHKSSFSETSRLHTLFRPDGGVTSQEQVVMPSNRHENEVKVAASSCTGSRRSSMDESCLSLAQKSVQHDFPPPMHKMSMGKYKIPEIHRHAATLGRNVVRRHEPGRHSPHWKRRARLIPNHVVNYKAISKSFENVTASDDDPISGASSMESLTSNASLPTAFERSGNRNSAASDISDTAAGRISHWAVSFDRLLDDPLGVRYFKEFLRKEFSEENILFWEACEELRRMPADDIVNLKKNISDIYKKFLSPDATMSVNIDSQGVQLAEEALKLPPHPNIFQNQQQQIHTLMRLDSYSRFLKSSLFRQCMMSEMEGVPLPLDVSSEWNSADVESLSRTASGSLDGTLSRKNKKSKSTKKGLFSFKNRSKSQKEHRAVSRQSSGDSTESDPSFPVSRSCSLPVSHIEFPDPSRVCQVTLWDGNSTVIYAKKEAGTPVSEVLANLCENRGVQISALDAFILEDGGPSNVKQRRPLSMEMDVSELAAHSIILERRALFRLDMMPVKKSVGVKARPSKSIADVLKPVLRKFDLNLTDMVVTVSGDGRAVDLEEAVMKLDNLRICVDKKQTADEVTSEAKQKPQQVDKTNKISLKKMPDRKETEELIHLMSTLQNSKLNDQRGLLSKADLELPDFLKIKPLNHNANNNLYLVTNQEMTSESSDSCEEASTGNQNDFSAARGHATLTRLSGSGRMSVDRKRKCYVELNSRPKSLISFKPSSGRNEVTSKSLSFEDPDTTITGETGSEEFDANVTLKPLPTPPPANKSSCDYLPMANFSPPTPLQRSGVNRSRDMHK